MDNTNIQVDRLIATVTLPVYQMMIGEYEKFNLKNLIIDYRKKYPNGDRKLPSGTKDNVGAWVSSWTTHKVDKRFQSFATIQERILKRLYLDMTGRELDFVCDELWIAQYEKGDSTTIHNHIPFHWSSVFYVDVERGCAPLLLGDVEESVLEVQPKNGMLVMFPAWITHAVLPTLSKRTIIASNFYSKLILNS